MKKRRLVRYRRLVRKDKRGEKCESCSLLDQKWEDVEFENIEVGDIVRCFTFDGEPIETCISCEKKSVPLLFRITKKIIPGTHSPFDFEAEFVPLP